MRIRTTPSPPMLNTIGVAEAPAFHRDAVAFLSRGPDEGSGDRERGPRQRKTISMPVHERDRTRRHPSAILRREPEDEAQKHRRHRRGDRSCLVRALPEQAEEEHDRNSRREEAGDFLDVLECLLRLAEQRPDHDQRNDDRERRNAGPTKTRCFSGASRRDRARPRRASGRASSWHRHPS